MKKVFVGLSGGVDSAVSAALLKEQGYDVVGVFIKIWQPEFIECTWQEDRLDAMRVCAALSIPFREIDLSQQYKKEVIDRMIAQYTAGITPNPDVLCNRHIKFGAFASWARECGADKIATGHYARIEKVGGEYNLLRAADSAKDQSYFLHRLVREDLACALLPIGHLNKKKVRELARHFDLTNAQKPDSQGLCFVGEITMRDFLTRFIPVIPGDVIDTLGRPIGTHEGMALYTVGQRHGFSVHADIPPGPWYVVGIDAAGNRLYVSTERADAMQKGATVRDISWTADAPALPARFSAQCRYHEQPVSADLAQEGDAYAARFEKPHMAAPGQSIVFYRGDECVGGGVIAKRAEHIGVHSARLAELTSIE